MFTKHFILIAVLFGVLFSLRGATIGEELRRAQQLFEKGQLRETEQVYNQLIARDSKCTNAYLGRGGVRIHLGNMAGAVEDFTQVLTLRPDDEAALQARATIYFE